MASQKNEWRVCLRFISGAQSQPATCMDEFATINEALRTYNRLTEQFSTGVVLPDDNIVDVKVQVELYSSSTISKGRKVPAFKKSRPYKDEIRCPLPD